MLLSIDWQSPLGVPEAYVYLVDLEALDLSVVIPATYDLANISLLGVTPNESEILFTDYSTHIRILHLWSLTDGSVRSTNVGPPIALRWFSDHTTFLGAGWVDDLPGLSVYLYNIENQQFENLTPVGIETAYRLGSIQISSNLKTIAYLDDNSLIYIIDCPGLAQ